MALVGNMVSCLRIKSETESVTPDTAFRFNSKDDGLKYLVKIFTLLCIYTMQIDIQPCVIYVDLFCHFLIIILLCRWLLPSA
jgi:hypothetical protein